MKRIILVVLTLILASSVFAAAQGLSAVVIKTATTGVVNGNKVSIVTWVESSEPNGAVYSAYCNLSAPDCKTLHAGETYFYEMLGQNYPGGYPSNSRVKVLNVRLIGNGKPAMIYGILVSVDGKRQ